MTTSGPRCLLLWAVSTTVAAALAGWLGAVACRSAAVWEGPVRFDEALVGVCASVGLLATAWLWLATTAVVAEALLGGRGRAPGVPEALRRAVLAGCGVAVVAGVAGVGAPAGATPGELHLDHLRPAASIAGLPLPERSVGPAASSADRPASASVVVGPGDSLWAIARTELGPAATDAEVDTRWREIYATNRAAVGPDPDLVRPGERLRLPRHERLTPIRWRAR